MLAAFTKISENVSEAVQMVTRRKKYLHCSIIVMLELLNYLQSFLCYYYYD